MLTQDRLKDLLIYDEHTGLFRWIKPTGTRIKAGSVAGTLSDNGYVKISIDRKLYRAHRLAWLYVYGHFPDNELDHVNRVKSDNRIENLRPATCAENQQNQPKRRTNKSGVVGVCWYKRTGKWRAQITAGRVKYHLGYFDNLEDALCARAIAKAKYHTFHPESSDVSIQKEASNHRHNNCRD